VPRLPHAEPAAHGLDQLLTDRGSRVDQAFLAGCLNQLRIEGRTFMRGFYCQIPGI
jgi:hypothetical protein